MEMYWIECIEMYWIESLCCAYCMVILYGVLTVLD